MSLYFLDIPKSTMYILLISASLPVRMFSGLMSLWMTPLIIKCWDTSYGLPPGHSATDLLDCIDTWVWTCDTSWDGMLDPCPRVTWPCNYNCIPTRTSTTWEHLTDKMLGYLRVHVTPLLSGFPYQVTSDRHPPSPPWLLHTPCLVWTNICTQLQRSLRLLDGLPALNRFFST